MNKLEKEQMRAAGYGAPPQPKEKAVCQICGEPMPPGEEMFNYHGYSCDCPKPPLSKPAASCEFSKDINSWLSAALVDSAVASEMKEAIEIHFEREKTLSALYLECKEKSELSQAHQSVYLWFVEKLGNIINEDSLGS